MDFNNMHAHDINALVLCVIPELMRPVVLNLVTLGNYPAAGFRPCLTMGTGSGFKLHLLPVSIDIVLLACLTLCPVMCPWICSRHDIICIAFPPPCHQCSQMQISNRMLLNTLQLHLLWLSYQFFPVCSTNSAWGIWITDTKSGKLIGFLATSRNVMHPCFHTFRTWNFMKRCVVYPL